MNLNFIKEKYFKPIHKKISFLSHIVKKLLKGVVKIQKKNQGVFFTYRVHYQ